jgi:hypothetical protein
MSGPDHATLTDPVCRTRSLSFGMDAIAARQIVTRAFLRAWFPSTAGNLLQRVLLLFRSSVPEMGADEPASMRKGVLAWL